MLSLNKQSAMDKFINQSAENSIDLVEDEDNSLIPSTLHSQKKQKNSPLFGQPSSSNQQKHQRTQQEQSSSAHKALAIKARIDNATIEQLPGLLQELEDKWKLNTELSYIDEMSMIMENLNIQTDYTVDTLEAGFKDNFLEVIMMKLKFSNSGLLKNDSEDGNDAEYYMATFNRLTGLLYYSKETMLNMYKAHTSIHPTLDVVERSQDRFFTYSPIDFSKNNSYQNLLMYTLGYIQQRGYKRNGEFCAKKIFTPSGHFTRCYEDIMSIQDLVSDATRKELNYNMWYNTTISKDNLRSTVKYLSACCDPEFEPLKFDRHVFAFNNGVYVGYKTDKDTDEFSEEFIPYDRIHELDPRVIAANYFDMDFDEFSDVEDWFDIPTPNGSKIMISQEWSTDVQRILWAFIGRCLYEVNELDGWQVCPLIKGQAGTGKSTLILNVVKRFYKAQNVAVLGNNIEKKFGLQGIYDKTLFVAPEVKKDFGLDQADFQTAVSGEETVINRKFEQAIPIKWTVPGIFAGNEIPDWTDNSESISRRWLPFQCEHRVKDKDPKLGDKLYKELPAIMLKANRAYHELVKKYGHKDIWDCLPKYFIDQRKAMAEASNSLSGFLSSDKVLIGAGYICTEVAFKQAYKAYCNENNYSQQKWTKDYIQGPLSYHSIKRANERKIVKDLRGVPYKGNVMHGVGIHKEHFGGSMSDSDMSDNED